MNVAFSPSICEDFINKLHDDSDYLALRKIATDIGVPSLESAACAAVTNIVAVKKPTNSIDIGCGIGVSSLAVLKGFPATHLTALDGNLERLMVFENFFKTKNNVKSYQIRGEAWLAGTSETYDFAFIDSVKREYPEIWRRLRPRMNEGGIIIFDDILLYGYVLCEDAEIPQKYLANARLLREFIAEIFGDKSLHAQLIPVSGGLLVVSLG